MPGSVPPVVPAGSLAGPPQPVIDGEGLRLRPFDADDVPLLLEAFEDPAIRLWHLRTIDSPSEAQAWIADAEVRRQREQAVNWVVLERDATGGEEAVGRISVTRLDLSGGRGEISYWVLPQHRGRRVATRAVKSVTAWAFGSLGLHRLELMHATANQASCAVATGAGFEVEGTARRGLLHEDGWHDMHLHARLADDDDGV